MKNKVLNLFASVLIIISMAVTATVCTSAAVITDGETYYTAGDANGDGCVDIRDLVNLKKCSAQQKLCPAADFDADGNPSAADLLILRKILLGVDNSLWSEIYK